MEKNNGVENQSVVIAHGSEEVISIIGDEKLKPKTLRKRRSRVKSNGGIKRKRGRPPAMTEKAKALFNIHGQTFLDNLDGFYFPDFLRLLRSQTPGLKELQ